MKRLLAALVCAGLALPVPAQAQTNDDDYTPLGSRIKRDRQFPTELPPRFSTAQMTKVNRDRSKAMLNQFSACLYRRSNEDSLALLAKTDFGFVAFEQIGLTPERAAKLYGFQDCLSRVAFNQNSGVALRFSAGALRQWLVQEAYFARFPEGAAWVKPGNAIGERKYPLSDGNPGVRSAMDFSDCVVQADPFSSDYFYRAPAGSEEEKAAIAKLMPTLGPCFPQGQQVRLSPPALRVWLGESLWHAATNSAPPFVAASAGGQ